MAGVHDLTRLGKKSGRPEDSTRLDRLLAEHRDRIYHYIYASVHNEADAEDICQRCSVVMWRKFSDFDPDRSFLAWAFGIAYFEIQNYRRTTRSNRTVFSEDLLQFAADRLDRLEQVGPVDRLAALQQCLARLPERDRRLVNEIYWDGLSYLAAAERCNLSVRTVYNRMHLIRRRLLGCVQQTLRDRRPSDE